MNITSPRVINGKRAASTFTSAAHRQKTQRGWATWIGQPGILETYARDHVQAAGLDFVQSTESIAGAHAIICTQESLENLPGHTHAPLLLVTSDPPTTELLHRAIEKGIRSVRMLPKESSALLADLLICAENATASTIITVIPGHGGAGASALAARLAGASARSGLATALLDCDELGGGLDVLVHASHVDGARWHNLAGAGSGSSHAIRAALPLIDNVRILTFDPQRKDDYFSPAAVIGALSESEGVVIADVPAHSSHLGQWESQYTLMVVQPSQYTLSSCRTRLAQIRSRIHGPIALAIRHPHRGKIWDKHDVEEVLELPVALDFTSYSPEVTPLLDVRRHGADRACTQFLAEIASAS